MKTIEEIADILELQIWAAQKSSTASALKEELESILDETDKAGAEKIAQNVIDEVSGRQQMLGNAYPFETDGYSVRVSHPDPATTTYLFCLGLSLLPSSEIHNEQRCLQFETVVMNAAQTFFGGDAIRIGAPWATAEIPDYSTLLDRVIDLVPNLGEKLKTTPPGGGDAGWDVLVVRNFSDKLIPRFIALGNCATGRTDWKRKGMESQPGFFWSHFQSEHRSVFITFFAVPFTMDEEARLRKLSSTTLTFDRLRICEYAPTVPIPEMVAWLESQRGNALKIALN
jgi:hypothetical protein